MHQTKIELQYRLNLFMLSQNFCQCLQSYESSHSRRLSKKELQWSSTYLWWSLKKDQENVNEDVMIHILRSIISFRTRQTMHSYYDCIKLELRKKMYTSTLMIYDYTHFIRRSAFECLMSDWIYCIEYHMILIMNNDSQEHSVYHLCTKKQMQFNMILNIRILSTHFVFFWDIDHLKKILFMRSFVITTRTIVEFIVRCIQSTDDEKHKRSFLMTSL